MSKIASKSLKLKGLAIYPTVLYRSIHLSTSLNKLVKKYTGIFFNFGLDLINSNTSTPLESSKRISKITTLGWLYSKSINASMPCVNALKVIFLLSKYLDNRCLVAGSPSTRRIS